MDAGTDAETDKDDFLSDVDEDEFRNVSDEECEKEDENDEDNRPFLFMLADQLDTSDCESDVPQDGNDQQNDKDNGDNVAKDNTQPEKDSEGITNDDLKKDELANEQNLSAELTQKRKPSVISARGSTSVVVGG